MFLLISSIREGDFLLYSQLYAYLPMVYNYGDKLSQFAQDTGLVVLKSGHSQTPYYTALHTKQ